MTALYGSSTGHIDALLSSAIRVDHQTMDDALAAVAHANGGYLFRHQLNSLGYTDRHLRAMCRRGELIRVRHGTYVEASLWSMATPIVRHAVLTRSVLDKLGPAVAASHVSAAVLHGLDIWGADLRDVHVTRLEPGSGRHEAGVVHHENVLDPADIVEIEGRAVAAPGRSAIEHSATTSVESGMVTVTSALRHGVPAAELEEEVERCQRWPGVSRARLAVRLADAGLESVGEVRSLHMMWQFGIPRPVVQHELRLASGRTARVDDWWEDFCHVGEFDGLVKYGRLNPHRDDPGQAIVDEKIREDGIRALRLGVSRWTWSDLAWQRRGATAIALRRAMEQSQRLFGRSAVHVV